jgi:hypothetical protein
MEAGRRQAIPEGAGQRDPCQVGLYVRRESNQQPSKIEQRRGSIAVVLLVAIPGNVRSVRMVSVQRDGLVATQVRASPITQADFGPVKGLPQTLDPSPALNRVMGGDYGVAMGVNLPAKFRR